MPKRSSSDAELDSNESDLPPREFKREGRGSIKPQTSPFFRGMFFEQYAGRPVQMQQCSKRCSVELLHSNPNIWKIDGFITAPQLKRLERVIPDHREFESSYVEDLDGNEVFDPNRTSNFHSFKKSEWPIVRELERKAAEVMGMPADHVEPGQVVKYSPGEYFGLHHDSGAILDDDRIQLPPSMPLRLATVFVYLTDMPDGVGCTVFPKLNVSVTPKRGSALVFANVTEHGEPDIMTSHEAQPLLPPHTKMGVNFWVTDRTQ